MKKGKGSKNVDDVSVVEFMPEEVKAEESLDEVKKQKE